MKQQVFNPYLPSWEYIPDGEPYVFGDRLYIYGSHDKFDGDQFCMNDYVCWSAPTDDLSQWRYEGVIYRKDQDPRYLEKEAFMFAPDVQKGPDGRYYIYYIQGGEGIMAVAVCDEPAGQYEFYGYVRSQDGHIIGAQEGDIDQFDPGVFIDDDGRVFLYTGFGPKEDKRGANFHWRPFEGGYVIELEADMLTAKGEPVLIVPKYGKAEETSFEGHEFFEASSMRKIGNTYYFIYSSINSHELNYATSQYPDRDFVYGGTIVSNGDIGLHGRREEDRVSYTGNTHGSIVEVNGQWYVFYHRQTNRHCYSRQGCAEPIRIMPDGSIPQVEITSCGLNGKPLTGKGTYGAYIACSLTGKNGAGHYSNKKEDYAGHPYFTQDGPDYTPVPGTEGSEDAWKGASGTPVPYIAEITDGTLIGYKYFDLRGTTQIEVEVRVTPTDEKTENSKGLEAADKTATGKFLIKREPNGAVLAEIPIRAGEEYQTFSAGFPGGSEKDALYFRYIGKGAIDMKSFTLN
ncbi:hypothetical protein B5F07_18090 [Lachnoclostridium sp. An169]|uniref:family 43 glycosylhydrolase n=1 Tax=Lachnoclostridium sp. An169 TaxID=1965569 RepID=UPI000B3942CA|nr:family 43 glycosylhydrolase [Lachnoclostridium sp. An169]OUP81267.1 hypothetical protein B5F07_18090 [Lachnoclostridium sp. An169]